MNLLVTVEDPALAAQLQAWADEWGYRAQIAADAVAALEALHEWAQPCLLVLDWQDNHLALCRRFKSSERTYLLLLTDGSRQEAARAALEAGADDVLARPLEAETFRNHLALGARLLRCRDKLASARTQWDDVARYDSLTGFNSRRQFQDELQQAVEQAARTLRPLCLAAVNLDNFPWMRQNCPREICAEVLFQFSQCLRPIMRPGDLAGAGGAGEYYLALPGQTARPGMLRLHLLRERLRATRFEDANGKPFSLSLSFGLAEWGPSAPDAAALLTQAEHALIQAEQSGPGHFGIHEATRDVFRADVRRRGIIVIGGLPAASPLSEAQRDPLTALPIPAALQERLQEVFDYSLEFAKSLSLCLFEVDDLDGLARRYGPDARSRVLPAVAGIIQQALRHDDFVGRFGEHGFCLVFPDTEVYAALNCLHRIREHLARLAVDGASGRLAEVSCNFGVAQRETGMAHGDELLRHAGEALEQAKRLGRDQLIIYRTA